MINADENRVQLLREAVARQPRVGLAHLPTPIDRCRRLSDELGGPQIWIKRDDLTGLATGGNKTRMFEFLLGEAVDQGADAVVAGAAIQSNNCRQLAAACAKLGLRCHLILRQLESDPFDSIQGNLLLDLIVGAQVEIVQADGWATQGELIRQKAKVLEESGHSVYVARVGDESRLGLWAIGYVNGFIELVEQAEALETYIDELWVCSSDTTLAGLLVAAKFTNSPMRLKGVSAIGEPVTGSSFPQLISDTANQCADMLGLEIEITPEDVDCSTDYVGPGYSVPSDAGLEAIWLVGRTEGILLDPSYSSKAMAALIEHVRLGKVSSEGDIVFLHTGGVPALFAQHQNLGIEELLDR